MHEILNAVIVTIAIKNKLCIVRGTLRVHLVKNNGEGGIRTLGLSRVTRFQVERDRPLCHLSSWALI